MAQGDDRLALPIDPDAQIDEDGARFGILDEHREGDIRSLLDGAEGGAELREAAVVNESHRSPIMTSSCTTVLLGRRWRSK